MGGFYNKVNGKSKKNSGGKSISSSSKKTRSHIKISQPKMPSKNAGLLEIVRVIAYEKLYASHL